jgi:hypothetical protein
VGHDAYTGWGRLDVARAVAVVTTGPLPSTDAFETNDDAGTQAYTLWGKKVVVNASLDYYDDPVDVYRVALSGHERLTARLASALPNAAVSLVLWKPNTTSVGNLQAVDLRAAQSAAHGAVQQLTFTAPGRGWYYLEAKVMSPGFGPYSLVVTKTP